MLHQHINISDMGALLVFAANNFQMGAHGAKGQVRKFSGLPYSTHPQAVLQILLEHYPLATPETRAAALLHDVIEDTDWTLDALAEIFGDRVARLVFGLTNVKVPGMNRAEQKRHDAARLAAQEWTVKLIKLCDRLHNLPDIIANDPSHAKVYVPETRFLLDTALRGVHDVLWCKLDAICNKYFADNTVKPRPYPGDPWYI